MASIRCAIRRRALSPLRAIYADHCHAPASNPRIHTFKLPGLDKFQLQSLSIWKRRVRELLHTYLHSLLQYAQPPGGDVREAL